MNYSCTQPVGLRRPALAAAIALVLCGPAYAADPLPTMLPITAAAKTSMQQDMQAQSTLRVSELLGRDVHDTANDELGEIDDLVMSGDGDKIMAIVSVGGLMGIGSKLVSVPYKDLRVTQNGEHIALDTTKNEFDQRAEFTYAKDMDMDMDMDADKARVQDDRRSAIDGRQSPVAANAAARGMDNDFSPADNASDRGQVATDTARGTRTPFDQSNATADVDVTRAIRKGLVDDDSLGTNAQNVKVVTADGMVTLRGSVENSGEQDRVVAIAKQSAGSNRVQNELQVNPR